MEQLLVKTTLPDSVINRAVVLAQIYKISLEQTLYTALNVGLASMNESQYQEFLKREIAKK